MSDIKSTGTCHQCGTESQEPESALTPPFLWPCPKCGDDLLRQVHDGGMLVPPTFARALIAEEAGRRA